MEAWAEPGYLYPWNLEFVFQIAQLQTLFSVFAAAILSNSCN